jgi:secreted trypsin-like serine protease
MRKLLLVLLVAACAATAAQAITYGQADGNRHPMVGALVGTFDDGTYPFCSGTLISPTVFLTAAHCDISDRTGNDTACVTFDPQLTSKSKLSCGTFTPSPNYTHRQNDPNDVAVVVFDQPVRGIAPATIVQQVGYLDRLLASGELNQSTEFVSVGYGGTEFTNAPGGPTTQYLDTRMYATGRFNALGPGYIRISQNPSTGSAGTCYGDSGGPQFLDGVQVSVTVTGDVFCKSTNVVQRLDTELVQAFLQQYL